MAVFSWLGVTISDIKTYFSALWFLKAHFLRCSCSNNLLIPWFSSPSSQFPDQTTIIITLFCFPLHLNVLFLHERNDDDNEDIGVQGEATRTCNVKYSQIHSPG